MHFLLILNPALTTASKPTVGYVSKTPSKAPLTRRIQIRAAVEKEEIVHFPGLRPAIPTMGIISNHLSTTLMCSLTIRSQGGSSQ